MPSASHIVVIGAGAFGGWTALSLLRQLAGPMVANAILEDTSVDPMFGFARFAAGTDAPQKWA